MFTITQRRSIGTYYKVCYRSDLTEVTPAMLSGLTDDYCDGSFPSVEEANEFKKKWEKEYPKDDVMVTELVVDELVTKEV